MNQKLSLSSNSAVVKDGLEGVLVVFSVDRWGLQRNSSRKQDRIILVRLSKTMGMDLRMDLVFVGQFESVI